MSNATLLAAASALSSLASANEILNLTDCSGQSVAIPAVEIEAYIQSSQVSLVFFGLSIGMCAAVLALMIWTRISGANLRETTPPPPGPIAYLSFANISLVLLEATLSAVITGSPSIFGGVAQLFLQCPAPYPVLEDVVDEILVAVNLLIYATVSVTFLLQVRVVFKTESKKVQAALTTFLGTICVLAAGFLTAAFALWTKILTEFGYSDALYLRILLCARTTFILYVVICSTLFMYKIAVTIVKRRQAGARSFGPLQVLLIASLQTLLIPGIHRPLNRLTEYSGHLRAE
jgi:Fungal pheromone mating factor STE2 GPCR